MSTEHTFSSRREAKLNAQRTKKTQSSARKLIVPVALVLAGVLLFLYPVLATQFNNQKQREFAEEYQAEVESIPAQELAEALASARKYNSEIAGIPILDPWLLSVMTQDTGGEYQRYLNQLSMSDAMARVRVPSVDIDLPIYHGTDEDTMASGVGHLYGTSLPVGGEGTHSVLTTHTAWSTATLFDNLIDVVENDIMYIDVAGETLAYKVDNIEVVLPDEVSSLQPVAGEDRLTLFTCTPYSVNTHRLLVQGHRIPYDPSVPGAEPTEGGWTMQPWMYALLAGALFGLFSLLFMWWAQRRRKRRLEEQHKALLAEEAVKKETDTLVLN